MLHNSDLQNLSLLKKSNYIIAEVCRIHFMFDMRKYLVVLARLMSVLGKYLTADQYAFN